MALNITPQKRKKKIIDLIKLSGYEYANPHPSADNKEALLSAIKSDKKRKNGYLTFIVPDTKSARAVVLKSENEIQIAEKILTGGLII
jgi:3-dehydroquinate synthetase